MSTNEILYYNKLLLVTRFLILCDYEFMEVIAFAFVITYHNLFRVIVSRQMEQNKTSAKQN